MHTYTSSAWVYVHNTNYSDISFVQHTVVQIPTYTHTYIIPDILIQLLWLVATSSHLSQKLCQGHTPGAGQAAQVLNRENLQSYPARLKSTCGSRIADSINLVILDKQNQAIVRKRF